MGHVAAVEAATDHDGMTYCSPTTVSYGSGRLAPMPCVYMDTHYSDLQPLSLHMAVHYTVA